MTNEAEKTTANETPEKKAALNFEKWKWGVMTGTITIMLSIIAYFLKGNMDESRQTRINSEVTKEKVMQTNEVVIKLQTGFELERVYATEWRNSIEKRVDKVENAVNCLESANKKSMLAKKAD